MPAHHHIDSKNQLILTTCNNPDHRVMALPTPQGGFEFLKTVISSIKNSI